MIKIWFYFQYKNLKCQKIWIFITIPWKLDLVCSSNNLWVKIIYGNHTQSLFVGTDNQSKFPITWFQAVRADSNQKLKCFSEKKSQKPRTVFSNKIYCFKILKYIVFRHSEMENYSWYIVFIQKQPIFSVIHYPDNGRFTDQEKTAD